MSREKKKMIVPVILAGGMGMRLRPLTSSARPKPFLKIFSRYSFLQHTLRRFQKFSPAIIICGAGNTHKVKNNARAILHALDIIIAEPMFKSTAPAIALAAHHLAEKDAYMFVSPSDHWVKNSHVFDTVTHEYLEGAGIVIFGVSPKKPAMRYGYIKCDVENTIQSFIEKPNKDEAQRVLSGGHVYWNTGIFMISAKLFLRVLQTYAPDVFKTTQTAYEQGQWSDGVLSPDRNSLKESPVISVDHAIMENAPSIENINMRVVPLESEWHDIGCFSDLAVVQIKRAQNVFKHKILNLLKRNLKK